MRWPSSEIQLVSTHKEKRPPDDSTVSIAAKALLSRLSQERKEVIASDADVLKRNEGDGIGRIKHADCDEAGARLATTQR